LNHWRKELSLDDKVAFGEKHVGELVSMLEDGLRSFDAHGSTAHITVEIENRGTEELSVVLPGYGYSIDLIETERKSIARTIIVPAWQVTGYKVHLASRWHPEEVEDVPLSEHANHLGAVAALIKSLLSEEVDRWIENRSIESMKSDEELCEDADVYGVYR
jgi:hypothetical protein